MCSICLKTLSNESMKSEKLKRHLNTMHEKLAYSPLTYFDAKLKAYNKKKHPLSRYEKLPNVHNLLPTKLHIL